MSVFNPNSIYRKLAKLNLRAVNGKFALDHLIKVEIHRSQESAAQQWCQDRFNDEWIWSSPTQTERTTIFFKNTEDALAFRLAFAVPLTA